MSSQPKLEEELVRELLIDLVAEVQVRELDVGKTLVSAHVV